MRPFPWNPGVPWRYSGSAMKPTIAVDFDGVINSYTSGFHEHHIPDPPVPGALEFLAQLQGAGYHVAVFSTRANNVHAIRLIRQYLERHLADENRTRKVLVQLDIGKLVVTNTKPKAKLYIDDRGYRFTGAFPSMKYVQQLAASPGMGTPPPESFAPGTGDGGSEGDGGQERSSKRGKRS